MTIEGKKYRAAAKFWHAGARVEPGHEINLTEREARWLLKQGRVEEIAPVKLKQKAEKKAGGDHE